MTDDDITLTFKGRVFPEILEASIEVENKILYADPDGPEGVFDIEISKGIITVIVNVKSYDENTKAWALVRAKELVTSIVDLYAFTLGYALQVLMDYALEDDVKKPLIISHSSVRNYVTEYTDEQFKALMELVAFDLDLKLALRDLILSLSTMNYSAIAACRAMEAIRNNFRGDKDEDNQAWKRMRKVLKVSRGYVQFVTDASQMPRHGHRGAALLFDQSDITHRAWIVMDRYFNYLLLDKPDCLPEKFRFLD